jgi:hypothetical protein
MSMRVDNVQVVVDSLNDLFVFIVSNLLSPKYYPTEEETCINMCEQWLETLTSKFKFLEAQKDASKGELLEFVETLRHEFANKTSHYFRLRGVLEA